MKKSDISKNISTIIFLGVIFVGFGSMVIGKVHAELVDRGIINKPDIYNNVVYIDWLEKYPFEIDNTDKSVVSANVIANSTKITENSNNDYQSEGVASRLISKYQWSVQKLKDSCMDTTHYLIGYYPLLEVNGYFGKIIGKTDYSQNNGIVKLDDNRLITIQNKLDEDSLDNIVDSVDRLAEFSEDLGIKFVYLGLPDKIDKDEVLPGGVKTYTNKIYDEFIKKLNLKNVDYIDLRKEMEKENISSSDIFYKTDHHWKIETGLWVARSLAKNINNLYNIKLDYDILDEKGFKYKNYPKSWIGSQGRTMTLGYCDLEDFNIPLPNYNIKFEVEYPDLDVTLDGKFEETMINWKRFDNIEDYYNNNLYEAFLYGCRALVKIDNKNNDNGVKILTINDSFSITMAPYLALATDEIHMIDTRIYNGNFFGSVRSYIKEYRPDIIVLSYMPEVDYLERLE